MLAREAATEPTAAQNRVAENLVRAIAAGGGNRGALRDYAQRCFANCRSKTEHGQMQQALHGVVAAAIANGRLASTDWATTPAPFAIPWHRPGRNTRATSSAGGTCDT